MTIGNIGIRRSPCANTAAPLSGLDPVEADRMRSFILGRRGRETLVVSSHNLGDIEKLCSHVAFIDAGRLERVDTLASITSGSGRVAVKLRTRPDDIAALEARFEGMKMCWRDDAHELAVEFDPSIPPEAANERLLPALFAFGVIAVSSGRTLEQAYLGR